MPPDETPVQSHRSGEHPVSYNELMAELRALRRENKDSTAEISKKIDGTTAELRNGEQKFTRHEGELKALTRWQEDHEEFHREEKEERKEQKRQADADIKAAAASGPHWAIQAAVTTAISLVTSGAIGGAIYLITIGQKVAP